MRNTGGRNRPMNELEAIDVHTDPDAGLRRRRAKAVRKEIEVLRESLEQGEHVLATAVALDGAWSVLAACTSRRFLLVDVRPGTRSVAEIRADRIEAVESSERLGLCRVVVAGAGSSLAAEKVPAIEAAGLTLAARRVSGGG